jgi:hypothetical protein
MRSTLLHHVKNKYFGKNNFKIVINTNSNTLKKMLMYNGLMMSKAWGRNQSLLNKHNRKSVLLWLEIIVDSYNENQRVALFLNFIW